LEKVAFDFLPHCKKLGFEIHYRDGEVVGMHLPYSPEKDVLTGSGVISNGAITTLLDTALGGAVINEVGIAKGMSTLDLRVDFFSASEPCFGVTATAECIKVTREAVFVRAEAYNDLESEPIAQAVAIFAVNNQVPVLEKKGGV